MSAVLSLYLLMTHVMFSVISGPGIVDFRNTMTFIHKVHNYLSPYTL
jgi:hypothetical protein